MNKTIVSRRFRGEQELPWRRDPCGTGDGLITTALLLAAGAGTRLQPLTDDRPKCLTEVRGIPILRRLLSCLVEEGFRRLVVGVGYRVQQSGEGVTLQVGFSHSVDIRPLPGVTLEVEGNNRILVRGTDKQAVGQMAAQIRAKRKPNAYTGKGVRYAGEQVRLKPGKSAGRTT